MMFLNDLVVEEVTKSDPCPICLEVPPRAVKHPAGCGHTVCVPCMRDMVNPPVPDLPEPSDFGAPAAADEDDSARSAWIKTHPEEFAAYMEEDLAIEGQREHQAEIHNQALKRCPVCRAEFSSWIL